MQQKQKQYGIVVIITSDIMEQDLLCEVMIIGQEVYIMMVYDEEV